MSTFKIIAASIIIYFLSGCSTTNSVPYKASTSNVISLQKTLLNNGSKVSVGSFSMGSGVEEKPLCRLMGPVAVSPGKGLSTYIKEAFQEELFLAQVYGSNSSNIISGRVEKLTFSSVSPANWEISMRISSNNSEGYLTSIKYGFETSFDAYSACKNVADAFSPAVQELLKQVVENPKFSMLVR